MIIYPAIVAVLCASFGTRLALQYHQKRKPHQLVWTFAFALGATAAIAYIVFIPSHDTIAFRIYYVCGGLLMAAYLGIGSLYLLAPRKVAGASLGVVIVASVVSILLFGSAGLDTARLASAAVAVSPGTNAIRPGPWKAAIALLNSFGVLVVVGGAAYSIRQMLRGHAPKQFVLANCLIAVGTLLAGAAGAAADQGTFAGAFWLVLALGFVVLFAGFTLTQRRPAR